LQVAVLDVRLLRFLVLESISQYL